MLKNYKAVNGQSIFDVCLNAYGTLDLLVKLLRDSGAQGVDDIPVSGQVYVYDDSLVVDQSVNQSYTLSGIRYATLLGNNGSTFYITPPIIDGNMNFEIASTYYISNADGTNVIIPQDKDGLSMIGYDIIQLEKEIRPIENPQPPNQRWVWSKLTGTLTLTNGESIDNGQTLFILYRKPLS